MVEGLNTTSYTVLGLLALQPWTAYALAAEMQHCFGYFWPRADSRSYAEADRLVELGHATAEQARVGRRHRTTYTITSAGRAALEAWLATPPKAVTLEFEGLIRVFFARFASKETLLADLNHIGTHAQELLLFAATARRAYLECRAPFQEEQVHVRALVFDFMVDYGTTLRRWVERTKAEVATWQDLSPDGKHARSLQLIERWQELDALQAGEHS